MARAIPFLLLSALCAAVAFPQETDPQLKTAPSGQETLDWAVALGGRFRQLHDPVTAAYSLGVLAGTVCAKDPAAGAELYRGSLERLKALTPAAFTSARHHLPSPSFTALWKFLTSGAAKCSPELQDLADTGHAKAKMQDESRQANQNLRDAFSAVHDDPDRAAQLARTALTSADPLSLDIPTLTLLLSALRDRAADVAGDLFPEALDFIATAPQPSPTALLDLGEYLFTAPKFRESPDVIQSSDRRQVGNSWVANFSANRKSTNPDDIRDYIGAAVKVLGAANDAAYDPIAAYAIASQMVPKVDDFAPDQADRLRQILSQVEQLAGSAASQVQAAVGGSQAADPEGGEGPRLRDRLVSRVLSSANSRRFAEARDLAESIDDLSVRSEVRVLINFAEAAAALEKKDAQWAFSLTNGQPRGVKRALLYAGIVAGARSLDEALGYFQLGLRDAAMLPAEQRLATTAALTAVILPFDPANGFQGLRLAVEAANDAYISPHQGRFDPQSIRKIYSGGTTTSTDTALMLVTTRSTCEAVDTGLTWHNFDIKVPGVSALSLPGLVRNAKDLDSQRAEAILSDLRDEEQMASALNSLAAMRLGR